MAKRLTIFYSWQSDSPSDLNRNFIEKALLEALRRLHSDATLENALRDAILELDKDTQGIAGSPPIAETILRKIEDCAVFVADLSFVGESKNGFTNASGKPRQFPNPNVLIEYGYALRCHSHAKIVGIMNTAYPSSAVPPINSELEARSLAANGNLQPMGRVSHYGVDRNIFGAIALEPPEDGKLYHFTQLFLSREIWGVDAMVLNANHIREQQIDWGRENPNLKYISHIYIEDYFVRALQNYLIFAQSHLQLSVPLRIEAGMVGIKDYPITRKDGLMAGKSLQDVIQWQAELSSYEKPAWETLAPFFDRIWNNCGIQRIAQQQAELAKRFGG
jgi:hypothetical protein